MGALGASSFYHAHTIARALPRGHDPARAPAVRHRWHVQESLVRWWTGFVVLLALLLLAHAGLAASPYSAPLPAAPAAAPVNSWSVQVFREIGPAEGLTQAKAAGLNLPTPSPTPSRLYLPQILHL